MRARPHPPGGALVHVTRCAYARQMLKLPWSRRRRAEELSPEEAARALIVDAAAGRINVTACIPVDDDPEAAAADRARLEQLIAERSEKA